MVEMKTKDSCMFGTRFTRHRGGGAVKTHSVSLAVVVARVRVESTQLHPAETHLILGFLEEAADVCSSLEEQPFHFISHMIQ